MKRKSRQFTATDRYVATINAEIFPIRRPLVLYPAARRPSVSLAVRSFLSGHPVLLRAGYQSLPLALLG